MHAFLLIAGFILTVFLTVHNPLTAQDMRDNDWESLRYGDRVTGEITDVAYETPYVFTGSAGDTIVAALRSQDRSLTNPLLAPVLVLRGPDNNILADTTAVYPIDDTTLIAELPEDGDYLLIATREGGPIGTSRGLYTLTLDRVPEVDVDAPIVLLLHNADEPTYLAHRLQQALSLRYTHHAGGYFPRVDVATIDGPTGSLITQAAVFGPGVTSACLGQFTDDVLLLIRLSSDESAFSLLDTDAEIRLRLSPAPCPNAD